jgi:hypothetical protein
VLEQRMSPSFAGAFKYFIEIDFSTLICYIICGNYPFMEGYIVARLNLNFYKKRRG